jgi:hypothetical protein
MLKSSSPGRVRLREPRLKGAACDTIANALRELPGVNEVRSNQITGSLLVLFEASTLSVGELVKKAETLLPGSAPALRLSEREQRTVVKRGMALFLGASLLSLFVSERAHVALGGAFLVLAGLHINQNRRTFLR